MKKQTIVILTFTLVSLVGATLAVDVQADSQSVGQSVAKESKTGFLIPSQCQPQEGSSRPEGPYDDWPAPHTTECALREGCIASGYGLWVMGEKAFYRFDEPGQGLALDYFRTTKRTSYNKVEIVGDFRDAESVEILEMKQTD